MRWLIIDVATAALPDASVYLEGSSKAPANYKDPEKIAAYLKEADAERLNSAALDLDLARITGIGTLTSKDDAPNVHVGGDENDERAMIFHAALMISSADCIITYAGHNFDLPMILRRAMYQGIAFPYVNLDRYRSPHIDLCELLSDKNPQRRRSLKFYAKRLGWTDIHKTLDGAEEAQVPVTGRWEDLEASLRHDVMATHRLAQWVKAI
jgi:DNA polymerase elongation subunit (family B)